MLTSACVFVVETCVYVACVRVCHTCEAHELHCGDADGIEQAAHLKQYYKITPAPFTEFRRSRSGTEQKKTPPDSLQCDI